MTVDEPRISLPTRQLIACTCLAGAAVLGAWLLVGAGLGFGPAVARAGTTATGVTVGMAILSIVAMVPWIPKAASTALMAWLAASVMRMLGVLTIGLLLYSAPPAGPLGGLAGSRPAFLLAIAISFLFGLLVEVAVVGRSVLRHAPPSETSGR